MKNFIGIDDSKDGNISILSENKNNNINNKVSILERKEICQGNFKFKFEVNPSHNLIKPITISVGFEIDYYDETDMNVINEGNDLIDMEKNLKMGALYETLTLMRHFYVFKKTNTVHVLINVCSGKFFVVGGNELERKNNREYLNKTNSEILYLRSFYRIQLKQIKNVRPIFKYNKKDLNIVDININGNNLDNKLNKIIE